MNLPKPSHRPGLLDQLVFTWLSLGVLILAFTVGSLLSDGKTTRNIDSLLQSHADAVKKGYGQVFKPSKSSCGCPDLGEFEKDKSLALRVPSRCLPHNRKKSKGDSFRPMNRKGYLYPPVTYPAEYPDQYKAGSSGRMPFPGWPWGKMTLSKEQKERDWNGSKRNLYIHAYEDAWGGHVPWEIPQTLNFRNRGSQDFATKYTLKVGEEFIGDQGMWLEIKKGKADWLYVESIWHIRPHWQIHHIMERQFGGTNHPKNLIPVYSYPDRRKTITVATPDGTKKRERWDPPPNLSDDTLTNLHGNITIWWENILTDAECARSYRKDYREIRERMIEADCIDDPPGAGKKAKPTVLIEWPP